MRVLWAAFGVLGLAVGLNLLLTFGLVRRLREGNVLEPTLPTFGQVGARLPAFSVTNLNGELVTDADLSGEACVAILSTGCTPCATLAARMRADPWLLGERHLLAVVDDEHHPDAARQLAGLLPDARRVAVLEPEHPLLSMGGGISAFPTLLRLSDRSVTAASHRPEDLDLPAARTV